MQRAAASNAQPDASPKSSSTPGTPTPAEPPSKRRKVTGAGTDSPSKDSDLEAVRAAIAAENAKREAVLERKAQEAGDRWVLDFADAPAAAPARSNGDPSPVQVRSAGFAELDGDAFARRVAGPNWDTGDDESEEEQKPSARSGRMVFGKYKSKAAAKESEDESGSDDSSSEDEEEEEEEEEEDSEKGKARERLQAKKRQKREAERQAQEKRNKPVNLNKLTSISGGGGLSSAKKGAGGGKNVECFRCGKKGHTKANCPSSRR
jgi:hypothetical protein